MTLATSSFGMISKTKKRLCLWLGFLVLLLFPFSTRGYEEVTVTKSGTILGFVKVQGEPRDLPAPQVFKFKEVCKNVPNESLVVGPGRGLLKHAELPTRIEDEAREILLSHHLSEGTYFIFKWNPLFVTLHHVPRESMDGNVVISLPLHGCDPVLENPALSSERLGPTPWVSTGSRTVRV